MRTVRVAIHIRRLWNSKEALLEREKSCKMKVSLRFPADLGRLAGINRGKKLFWQMSEKSLFEGNFLFRIKRDLSRCYNRIIKITLDHSVFWAGWFKLRDQLVLVTSIDIVVGVDEVTRSRTLIIGVKARIESQLKIIFLHERSHEHFEEARQRSFVPYRSVWFNVEHELCSSSIRYVR